MQQLVAPEQPIERYEYKYLVPEELTGPICRAIAPYCEPDRHMAGTGPSGYTITSLYLDSPAFFCYRAKRDRHLDRFKLRLRTYDEQGQGAVFLEVKRKVNDRVIKYRSRMQPAELQQALASDAVLDHHDAAVRRFFHLCRTLDMAPAVLIRYHRAAFVGLRESYARVTLDRCIQAQAPQGYALAGLSDRWRGLDHQLATRQTRSLVVLELKFTSAIPLWMVQLARRFELWRIGFSKYANGLISIMGSDAPGQESLRQAPWTMWGAIPTQHALGVGHA